jgi:hypothetical protein
MLNIDKLENKLDEEVFDWLTTICEMERTEQAEVLTALYLLVDNALEQREKLDEISDALDMFCVDGDDEEEEIEEGE